MHRQHDSLPLLERVLLEVLDKAVRGAGVQTGAWLLLNKLSSDYTGSQMATSNATRLLNFRTTRM